MSDDDLFDSPNALSWDDIGRMNQDGFVENENLETHPVFFDDQFEMRSRELQASPPGMKTVDIFPSKQGPWSGNNQLGIGQLFAPDANNRQTILKLDEWGMPQMWTLCLGLSFDVNNWVVDSADASFDLTAVILFGIGGVVQEVEIDWLNGTAITLPMNALNVIAQFNPELGDEAAGTSSPPTDLILRASVAHGTLVQAQPTRTFRFNISNANQTILIPPFAKSVRLIPGGGFSELPPFQFYSSDTPIVFNSGVSAAVFGFILSSHAPWQFTEYLNVTDETCGRPVEVPIPTSARSITIGPGNADTIDMPLFVQFLIGV